MPTNVISLTSMTVHLPDTDTRWLWPACDQSSTSIEGRYTHTDKEVNCRACLALR